MGSGSQQTSEKLRSEPNFSDMDSFHAQYEIVHTIGHGGSAKVKLAQHRLTGTLVAVKLIHKREYWCNPVMSEVDLLMMVNHPNIISLIQVIDTKNIIYLITELCEGKTLYQKVREDGYLQEDEARALFKQILSAVNYCHNQGIIHRDLKPDNIMVEEDGKLKLIDFGLGTQVKPGQRLNLYCGTYPLTAPELILSRPYDGPKVDVWTLGIVLYFMLVGRFPFDVTSIPKLLKNIESRNYFVPSRLSIELQDLISLLMTADPKYRPTVAEVMMHPWVTEGSGGFPDPCEEQIPLKPDPAIVKSMGNIGFQAQDIEDSLRERKYNQTMATYSLLKKQILKECDSPTQDQSINPLVTPFPSAVDTATLDLGLRRSETEPTCLSSSTNRQVSVCGKSKRRDKRVRWHSVLCRVEPSSSAANTEDTTRASGVDQPVPSRGWRRGINWLTRKIGNAMRKLCCCIPSEETSHLGQTRVSPKK